METLSVIKSVSRHRPHMKLDIQQVSSDEDSSPCCDVIAVDNLRRQSTASNISRHSSCPDLARNMTKSDQWDEDVANMEDFEQTTDDFALNQPNLPTRVNKPYKLNLASGKFRQRLQSDQSFQEASADVVENLSSANSTPTSARHVAALMSLDKSSSTEQTVEVPKMTFSPTSSCDLPMVTNYRSYQASSRCSIAGSVSDFPSVHADDGYRDETIRINHQSNSGLHLTENTNCVSKRNQNHSQLLCPSKIRRRSSDDCANDDGNTKCQKWLQSLHISQTERAKSQSYINLPPAI